MQKSFSSKDCCVLLRVIHGKGCPFIYIIDGVDVDLPLACPGGQSCTESRAW
ncbi:hypothetical protein DPMN_116886 [Dreissena polymorpha]|uniref:Uncharacterized protein n=1 Tax=Dreissena polymorpha TaxID=45954 RepID=A0A9D4KQN1_DREPO|nr:hypothetical protein DPMN_116886 [Dreissena polymorpha]